MAETTVTPVKLVENTASVDLDDASHPIVPTDAGDGWSVINAAASAQLLLKFVADASSRTVTIKAGDLPPAKRQGLGDLQISLAANDVKYIVVEGARFLRSGANKGTINIVTSNTAVKCGAFIMPR